MKALLNIRVLFPQFLSLFSSLSRRFDRYSKAQRPLRLLELRSMRYLNLSHPVLEQLFEAGTEL
jgi:hypothetical protein